MTKEQALTLIKKLEKCHTENCHDCIFSFFDECPWNVKRANKAKKSIEEVPVWQK